MQAALTLATKLVQEWGVPGVCLVVVRDGREEVAFAHGLERTQGEPITPDTAFGLASLSKSITAALVVEHGLDVDAPVLQWLPKLDVPGASGIRLRHLLTHSAGLPGLPTRYHAVNLNAPESFDGGARDMDSIRLAGPRDQRFGFRDVDGLMAYLASIEIPALAAPGTLMSYSNEGYALLGAVLERATERSFEALVHDWADARSLGSVFAGSALRAGQRRAHPHHRTGDEVEEIAPWDNPAWFPAGGLCASARDMATFLLSDAFLAHALDVDMPMPSSGARYGLGVIEQAGPGGHTILTHDGTTDGKDACFCVVPSERLAVGAFTNVDRAGAPQLARIALNEALDLAPDTPEFELRVSDGPSGDTLDGFAGTYASHEGGRFELAHDGSTLQLVFGPNRLACPWVGEDQISLHGAPARFLRRSNGAPDRVWALAFRSRVFPRINDT